jgi:hypothetical protein
MAVLEFTVKSTPSETGLSGKNVPKKTIRLKTKSLKREDVQRLGVIVTCVGLYECERQSLKRK